jgi:hypothetical protein
MGNDRSDGFEDRLSGSERSETSIDKLKEIAREEIRKPAATQSQRKRVFISFKYEDRDKVGALRAQAKNESSELDFIDMSLKVPFDSDSVEYIKSGIRTRINSCSATLVYVSDSTHESKWVNWEIQESRRLGKRVVIIDGRESTTSKLPNAVEGENTRIVKWNHNDIMDAINADEE